MRVFTRTPVCLDTCSVGGAPVRPGSDLHISLDPHGSCWTARQLGQPLGADPCSVAAALAPDTPVRPDGLGSAPGLT